MISRYRFSEYPQTDIFPFSIGPALVEGGFHEHTHDFIELVVIRSGSGTHIINGRESACSAGDVYVFHRGVAHAFANAHALAMSNISFTPVLLRAVAHDVRTLAGYQALFAMTPASAGEFRCTLHLDPVALNRIRAMIETMQAEYTEKRAGYQTALRGYLAQAVVLLSRFYESAGSPVTAGAANIHAMADIAAFMEKNIGDLLTVDLLARRAAMSRRHFIRCFTRTYGKSPIRYLLDKRLEHAARLLQSTAMSITEIAFSSGFEDSNYFTRQFSGHYRLPPRSFRMLTIH